MFLEANSDFNSLTHKPVSLLDDLPSIVSNIMCGINFSKKQDFLI